MIADFKCNSVGLRHSRGPVDRSVESMAAIPPRGKARAVLGVRGVQAEPAVPVDPVRGHPLHAVLGQAADLHIRAAAPRRPPAQPPRQGEAAARRARLLRPAAGGGFWRRQGRGGARPHPPMSRRRAASADAAPRLRPLDGLRSWAADPSARGRETESESGGAASGPAAAALVVTRA